MPSMISVNSQHGDAAMQITNRNHRNIKNISQNTGLAPAVSQGTATTDNLSSLMKNTVVVVSIDIHSAIPSEYLPDHGTSNVRQNS